MRKKSKLTYGVIGLGRFGMALAVTLAESDNDVIVMDREESSIREMRNYTDYAFVTNDLSMEALREAGIHNCDVVIVCIGEKVDVSVLTTMSVIEMGVPRVIAKALSPAKVISVTQLEGEKTAMAVVPDDKLSLAIGKDGQNARLAVRLTGWKIDVKSRSAAAKLGMIAEGDGEDGQQDA